ncbi:unnamed protein product [Cylicocyclus nassatus]|uniref:Uncharacterized protein n=1 Tax=Cylicocyclus nassatus TaxID=53992 RepID=A0AA36GVM4_CYLNA|nr:unnamed protein product [Cylicocyclus nassatus]
MILLSVPLLFGIAYCAYPSGIVEVVLASESQQTASDDFLELFYEFARKQGIHLNKRNFRELESNINGLPVAKYGLRGIDCEKLRKFLGEIRSQKYRLQYASVKCGRTTVSFCMTFDSTRKKAPILKIPYRESVMLASTSSP